MKNKVTLPAEAVQDAVAAICAQKRTGQLRLNFSQGAPAGGAEWRESVTAGRPPLDSELNDLTKSS